MYVGQQQSQFSSGENSHSGSSTPRDTIGAQTAQVTGYSLWTYVLCIYATRLKGIEVRV